MKRFEMKPVNKMNKRQREELCKFIQDECDEKVKKILLAVPEKPSLNNYIISAIMNGDVQLKSTEEINNYLKQKVSKLGHGRNIVDRGNWYDDYKDSISFEVEKIFVLPEKYIMECKEYEEKNSAAKIQIEKLRNDLKQVKMHIMVGSNEALTPLMDQIDSIGMSSNNLLLSYGDDDN